MTCSLCWQTKSIRTNTLAPANLLRKAGDGWGRTNAVGYVHVCTRCDHSWVELIDAV